MNNVDALIIAEPSETNIVYAHKDQWIIKSLLKEKPHSSVPVVGFNAIKPLIQFIQDIDTEYDRISKELNSEKLDFSHLIKRIQSQLQQENNLDERS